jgi:hypothetical protein
MRIRRDSVFIATVLFTIALLCLIPRHWREVSFSREVGPLESLDAGFQLAAQEAGELGVIILISLIVTWKGYINRLRWAWLLLFIITWVWAFPLLALPPSNTQDFLCICGSAVQRNASGGTSARLDGVGFDFPVDGDCAAPAD